MKERNIDAILADKRIVSASRGNGGTLWDRETQDWNPELGRGLLRAVDELDPIWLHFVDREKRQTGAISLAAFLLKGLEEE